MWVREVFGIPELDLERLLQAAQRRMQLLASAVEAAHVVERHSAQPPAPFRGV
jgi:hypothetical protein